MAKFTKKNKATLDADAPAPVKLDAKLHQGYDPSTEFKNSGMLMGSVAYTEYEQLGAPEEKSTQAKEESPGFLKKFLETIQAPWKEKSVADFVGKTTGLSNFSTNKNVVQDSNGPVQSKSSEEALSGNAPGNLQSELLSGTDSANGAGARDAFVPQQGADYVARGGRGGGGSGGGEPMMPAEEEWKDQTPTDPQAPTTPVLLSPSVTITHGASAEGQAVSVNIQVTSDNSQGVTTSVILSGLPAGSVVSHGTQNSNGSWTLSLNDLNGLTITPPAYWSGNFNLSANVTSTRGSETATTVTTSPFTIEGVADAPTLSLQNSSGQENHAIALHITAGLTDTDGSETLSIIVGNIPSGAVLSAGVNNGDGTWTLTPAQLSNLTITPPDYFSGQINLNVTAVSSENGTFASATGFVSVSVQGEATTPNLSAQASSTGLENQAIALNIAASLKDQDGSETLDIMIAGIPAGAVLSAGRDNGDGTWTLTPAQLANLTLTPPQNWSGAINLTVTATSHEGQDSASISQNLHIDIEGVATAPNLSVTNNITGVEDTAIALNINAALVDADSENLSVTISNIPSGAVLSAGVNNGNGTWTLTPAQLSNLTLTPPLHWSGTLNLVVTATSSENGTTASTSSPLAVTVEGVATTPTLTVQNTSGTEDHAIGLNINAALVDTDGSETLSITISGVPAGATLSAGTNNGNGTWTLTPAQLQGLNLTPPALFSGQINLSVTAISAENGTFASSNATLGINVSGLATAPTLSVQSASGLEDTAVNLNINAALVDTDSEILSIKISGVPTGATLSAGVNNGNGVWTLSPQDLQGLKLNPPANASGIFNLSIAAISSENGTTAQSVATLPVSISGVADAPVLSVQPASGNEDSPISLSISANLTDTDGSETLNIIVSGVPAGGMLSAGTNNGNGTWTLLPSQLGNLTFTAPEHASGAYTLTVTAVASENGTSASTISTLSVNVAGVATTPSLNVHAADGQASLPIALDIDAALRDTDGSETLSIVISNVPAGAILTAGIDNGNGTWTLTPGQLSGLSIISPPLFSGIINLGVAAVSAENGTTAMISDTLRVSVGDVANTPLLSVQAANGDEDTAIALNINAGLSDNDGSETLSITISGVPSGAILSAGINNGNGTWTLLPNDLNGLKITPPSNMDGVINLTVSATSAENGTTAVTSAVLPVTVHGVADAPIVNVQATRGDEDSAIPLSITASLTDTDGSETLTVTISGVPAGGMLSAGTNNGNGTWTLSSNQLSGLTFTPPVHASGAYTLTVTATASENGNSASSTTSLSVDVDGVATTPSLLVQPASGLEDHAIAININSALMDNDGSETLSIVISNVPVGATLSAGTNNGNGTWTLTSGQLSGLTFTPPVHFSGTVNLGVTAISSENGTVASANAVLSVGVEGVASTPTLQIQSASGDEDTNIALNINAGLSDADSETLSVTISNVPNGATLSAGINNGNGTWTLTPAQLSGLVLTPPVNFSGSINLGVTATSSENNTTASTSGTLSVTIGGVADAPSLSVQAARGDEDTAIALNINAALTDNDGSETLSVTISGVPNGAMLSAGTNNGNGSWTLTPAQLSGLKITPADDCSGNFNLTVTATSSENGTTASTVATLGVTVDGVADAPVVSVQPASGNEDTGIPLMISANLTDTDGSETLAIVITGVPADATLSAGTKNADGSWSVSQGQLNNLSINPPEHFSGNISLTISATASENGTSATTSETLSVSVAGVATLPSLAVQAATGAEDTAIALNINAALNDTDGSETLSVVISGVPSGATLSAGTNNGNGVWTLTSAQLNGLTITPPEHVSGQFSLTISAISSENGTTATVNATLPVTVDGVATTPALSILPSIGQEDTAIPLAITAGLNDTDGSETLSVVITGVPSGATLSAGTNNGNGVWTLTPAQLSGLTITPPHDWSGSFNLGVTAVSSENGSTAIMSGSLAVTVNPVADAPSLSVLPASGNEMSPVALNINAALNDTDGSETLSIVIGNLPAGATLSAGTQNADGSWSLTSGQLSNLVLIPAANYSGAFNLSITAISSEGGTSASTSVTMPVSVEGVATTPSLSVQAASGAEDTAVPLVINAALVDTDSETLSITISGVPSGATLSAGTNNGNGSWTLTPAQLSGLTITPAHDWSGTINLSVTATSSENNTTASTTTTLPLTITGVADAPNLTVQAASGLEDQGVALNINAALSDTDGSESLTITVANVPAGVTLSAGTNNGNGTWTLSSGQLANLSLSTPANYSGMFTLNVIATSSESGTSAVTSASLPVVVHGVADAPSLSVQPAVGYEGAAIALPIAASLVDNDGSEILSVTIAGVPSGATLSAGTNNGNGTWTLTPTQLSNLTITPPAHWSGSLNLTVSATSSEEGTSATTSSVLPVTVTGVADAPSLSVQSASGAEDTAITLNINAGLIDNDGSETLSVVISGVPSGAVLSAGANNGNGSWTLTPAQLSGLTITPAANMSGLINLSVTAISTEGVSTAQTTSNLAVTITGVADTPNLSIQAASGLEDHAIPLSINAALTDTDGSEVLSVVISGVPSGATLSAGTNNGNGTWTLTPAQLSGLSITPALNWSGTLNLGVAATSSENGTTATQSSTLQVVVSGVADAPTLSVQSATGSEDHAVALNINAALTDTDGSETLSVTISGVPAGAVLSAGTNNGNGSWSLTPAQLSGLTITPSANFSGNFNLTVTATSSEDGTTATTSASLPVSIGGVADTPTLSVQSAAGTEDHVIALNISAALADTDGSESLGITISGVPAGASLSAGTNNGNGSWNLSSSQLNGLTITPPANMSGSFSLTVTATSSENGTTASTTSVLPVTVTGISDAPTLNVQPATGFEDAAIALNINAALTDTDGSETLSITVAGVPSGAILSAGTNNGNGTWTLTPAQLSGLTITPAANMSGIINLTVTATSSENGTTASNTTNLAVSVGGVADAPTLNVQAASGLEDHAIALNINAALNDTDGSETLTVRISGVPTGATLSAGTNNGSGTWTLTPAQLNGLTITPAANMSGSINLTVTATSSENGTTASTSSALAVSVAGVADAPTLSVQNVSGLEDQAIALNINAGLTDIDGSESLSVTIGGVPSGAILSAGTNNGNGTWTLTPAQLSGLTITPPANMSGIINLTVTATSSESGTTASTATGLAVTVGGVADLPTLSVQPAGGSEDTAIALNINASLTDTDGSETLAVTVSGVPSGAVLSAGTNNGNGSWTLTSAQLSGLKITPAANMSGLINLTVTATSSENGTTASTSSVLPVTVAGVADAPSLNVQAASGFEDSAIALNITSSLTDTDGSETLSVRISNVPSGAILSAGTNNGNGVWTLTPAQLSGLKITPPLHASGVYNLSVTAISSENGTTASTSLTLPVTVAGVATTPVLSVTTASGNEGAAISLPINAALADTDGSETLSVTISGVPAGATLSAGINNGNGSWTLTSAQLSNLTITTSSNFSGAFSLTVTAASSENGTTASISTALPVVVAGVADTPNLSVSAASGTEDSAIPLTITSSLGDTDGSEQLSLTITGVPVGAKLSAGLYAGNGAWTLTPAQLSGLTITPPSNFSGVIALNVRATATENNGDDISISSPLNVTVTPVADQPNLTVAAATGREDTAISLSISSSLVDTDGSESLSIKITGVPTGATLSAGTNNGGGQWTLTPAQLSNLKITPPSNSDADFTLMVTATSTDGSSTATKSASIPVTVTGAADTPTVTVSNTSGAKNAQVGVTIGGAVTDTDGSETITYMIGNVPDGFSFNQGTNNGNNTWTFTPSELSGLKMVSPYNFEGRVYMNAYSVSHDGDGDTAISAPTSFNVGVGNPLGIQLNLGLGLGIGGIGVGTSLGVGVNLGGLLDPGGIVVQEDSTMQLTDAPLLWNLVGAISYITVSGLPAGASLSAGTNLGSGVWKLTQGQLNNLNIITPPNSDEDFTLTISAKLLSLVTVNLATTVVHVIGVADQPTLSVANATGNEDATSIPVTVTSALTDTDGSETLSFMIKDLPTGFVPTVGINNGNGTWTVTAAQIGSLAVKPPANFSGDATFTIVAVSTEREGDSTIRTGTASIHVNPITDAPIISATTINGTEDNNVPLNLNIGLGDTDGSESLTAVTITGVPTGFSLIGATNSNGTWSANVSNLSALQLVPPAHWSGDLNLSITATSKESAGGTNSTTVSLPVHIEAVADAPITTATDSTGNRGEQIALHVGAALVDNDGSELLSAVISGVPDHAMLSAGLNNGDGTWTLNSSQLSNLHLTPADNFVGDINLTITAYSREGNMSTASSYQNFSVHVMPDAPSMMMMSMGLFDGGSNSNDNGWVGSTSDPSGDNGAAAAAAAQADQQSNVAPNTGSDYDQAFNNHQSG